MAGRREDGPLALAATGCFYVGGQSDAEGSVSGQMFVEYSIPAEIRSCPIVLIHGNDQNGSNYLGTPDDRQGWAEYFLRLGYPVYVIDQPARGRSPRAAADGGVTSPDPLRVERVFTGTAPHALWPQAVRHTQWPGSGRRGDAVFAHFMASQEGSLTDNVHMDRLGRRAGAALLRRIGRAILVTHSRSGAIGWAIADDVPELVAAIVALEPSGPPFHDVLPMPPRPSRAWGLTFDRITYDPPVADPSELAPVPESAPQAADLKPCWFPATPRRLPRLAGLPVLILTGEASYHAAYDHCTAQFLDRAGVANDFVPLASMGLRGNGHMLMLERNNLEVADVVAAWLESKVGLCPNPPKAAGPLETAT